MSFTKLTAETTGRLVEALAAGKSRARAARAAGIHSQTLCNWLRQARQGSRRHRELRRLVLAAERTPGD